MISAMLSLPKSTSAFLSLNGTDFAKLLRLALVGGLGVALTTIAEGLPSIDFGSYKPLADLAGILILETVRRFLTDNSK